MHARTVSLVDNHGVWLFAAPIDWRGWRLETRRLVGVARRRVYTSACCDGSEQTGRSRERPTRWCQVSHVASCEVESARPQSQQGGWRGLFVCVWQGRAGGAGESHSSSHISNTLELPGHHIT